MTRRYKKSEIRKTREFASSFVSSLLEDYLEGLNELELKMVKSEFDMLIDTKIVEILRNTEKKI